MIADASQPGPESRAVEQQRAGLALSAARMGEFEWDIGRDLFVVSERMAQITGLPPGAHPAERGAYAWGFIHAEDRDAAQAHVTQDLRDGRTSEVRYRMIRPDNGRVQWMFSAAMAVGEDDERKVVGVVQDITERKVEEDGRDGLIAELDHRVKNVLASVQSLASQSARKTVSLDAFLKTFAGRLEAMASAHTLLTATRWQGAAIGNIAAAELGGLAPGQARWEGPEIVLSPRATNALTLAFHELATNAVKFGALSVDTGRVEVSWDRLENGGFEVVWLEKNGPPVAQPGHRGFGSTLLDRVTGRELGGKAVIEFRPTGARAVLSADASALSSVDVQAPQAKAAAQPPPAAETTGGASSGAPSDDNIRGMRVLIVEDAVLLALELEAGLTEAGAKVVGVAADVEEGLRMAEQPIDAAVLDANLNGRSVSPVAEALQAKGVPFIIATGYGDAGPSIEGFDVPVVRKPYNVHQIAAAIVEARSQQRARAT